MDGIPHCTLAVVDRGKYCSAVGTVHVASVIQATKLI